MSRRRRTTARMFHPSGAARNGSPSENRASEAAPSSEPGEQTQADRPAGRITAEVLARRLEQEALLREASEERATSAITRTYRLTLALVAINTLIAGATIFTLWSRLGRSHEPATLTTAPVVPPQACAQPSVETPAPPKAAPSPAVPQPSAAPAVVPREATSPKSPPRSNKRESLAAKARPRRVAVPTPASQSVPDFEPADDGDEVALGHVAERW